MIRRLKSLFAEYKKFASKIVQDHNNDSGHDFHPISAEMELIHCYKDNECFKHPGTNSAANKRWQFFCKGSERPVVTFEHEGLIGQKREGNGNHPCDAVTDRSGKLKYVEAREIDQIVHVYIINLKNAVVVE